MLDLILQELPRGGEIFMFLESGILARTMGVLIVALAFPLHQLSCSHFCPQAKHDYVEQFLDFGFIIIQILGCLAVAVGCRV